MYSNVSKEIGKEMIKKLRETNDEMYEEIDKNNILIDAIQKVASISNEEVLEYEEQNKEDEEIDDYECFHCCQGNIEEEIGENDGDEEKLKIYVGHDLNEDCRDCDCDECDYHFNDEFETPCCYCQNDEYKICFFTPRLNSTFH